MQFKVLISFFFAYIAFVQAAPVQLPAGSPVNGLAIPNVAVPNAVRDLGAVDVPLPVDSPTGKVDEAAALVHAPVARSETVSNLVGDVPAADAKVPVALNESIPELPAAPTVLKRQDLPAVPAGDALASQLESGGALAEGLASGVRRQLPDLDLPEPVDLNIRQVEVPASALPEPLPFPTIPNVDELIRRQLETPNVPDVSQVDPAAVVAIPSIPDFEAPSPPSVVEPRQVEVPQPPLAGEQPPSVPTLDNLIERQVEDLPVPVPELDASTIEGIPLPNVAEAKREVVDAILNSVPSLGARQVAVGEPLIDLPIPEVTTPFTPELPTN